MEIRKKLACVVALMALALAAAACGSKAGSSPTATAKAFAEAVKNRDVQGIKNSMSKGSLAMMESFAKMSNKSLDEALKEPSSSPPPTFESRNEKITGDTATLEIKGEKGKWEEMPFVKEDGQWKIALDKAFEKGMSGGPEGGPAVNNPGTPGGGETKEGDDSKEDGGDHKEH